MHYKDNSNGLLEFIHKTIGANISAEQISQTYLGVKSKTCQSFTQGQNGVKNKKKKAFYFIVYNSICSLLYREDKMNQ